MPVLGKGYIDDQKIYDLLVKIDDGYIANEYDKQILRSVTSIDWEHYKFTKLPNSLGMLESLKTFRLSISKVRDISALSNLSSLTQLYLGHTEISDISALSNLSSLSKLDLNRTKISSINALSKLTSLTQLDLGYTEISDISALSNMQLLSRLYLGNTKVSDINALSNLSSLSQLFLWDTEVSDISALSNLKSLSWLDLRRTKISDISALSTLQCLSCLRLSDTRVNDISTLSSLKALETLDLSGIEINDLSALSELTSLKRLNLQNSKTTAIPENIFDLNLSLNINKSYFYPFSSDECIYIHGLTLTDQPVEVFSQSRELIIEYYKSTKAESTSPINECKVVFLGDGGAGKSLIIDRLMNNGTISTNFKGESTPGICINSKKYQIGNEEIELHFWDFGGQEIMHSMHRLFLTNRTLYVVVANARDNKANEQAWYWIRNIKSFANNAPVLLLVNQKDQNPSANVNVNGLRREYAELKEVRVVSALQDSKEEFDRDIRDAICRIVSSMETVHTPFSRSWLSLMNDLQKMKEDYITSDAFYTKCFNNHVDSKSEILDQIIGWYQDLGVCFYSKANLYAERYMVLKPRWLLNAIYILAFNGRRYAENGIIREKDLFALICEDVQEDAVKKVWNDIKYEPGEIQYIVYVLMNYELIYRLDNERFFIPMLCDDNEPGEMDFANSEDMFHVSYEYTYLPENVLHLLMVRHGYELNTETVWRTGAEFERKQLGWSSLVRIKDNCLDIYARSDNQMTHPVNSYLDMMRESISNVNDKLGIGATEYIWYRKDGLEDRFEHEILKGSKMAGQLTIYSKIFKRLLDIDEILGIIKSSDQLSDNDPNYQIDALVNSLMDSLHQLQGNSAYYNAKENTCNSYIRDLLEARGYLCKDQTLHGTSASGKSDGVPDIVIRDKDRNIDLSIYEALKLSAFGDSAKEYLINHLLKLLKNYNPTGITSLFLVSYVSWKREKFNDIADDYREFIMGRDIGTEFRFKSILPVYFYNDSFSRCLKVKYDCGGMIINVYHVLVRVAE